MTIQTIIKTIMKDRKYTHQVLADKLGYKSKQAVTIRLQSGQTLRIETVLNMLEEMDCELIVRSKLKDRSEWRVEKEEQ